MLNLSVSYFHVGFVAGTDVLIVVLCVLWISLRIVVYGTLAAVLYCLCVGKSCAEMPNSALRRLTALLFPTPSHLCHQRQRRRLQ